MQGVVVVSLVGFSVVWTVVLSGYTAASAGLSNSTDCEIYAGDIVFVLDESGSIKKENWEKVLAFVQDVVQTFDIGPDNTYFGVVTFGNGAQKQFDLQSFPTRDGLVEAIGNISYGGGGTDTAKAIDVLRLTMFNPKNEKGGRPGIPHIGIILTDGLSTEREATQQSAKEARDSGIILFAVGVGDTDYEELRGIASDPDDSHVFHVNDFSSFQLIHDKLVRDVCHDLCPKDWKRIGNKCFFLSSYQTSCLQASKRCTALHYKARLATARNKHEFKTLTKQLVFPATQHTRSYFIGLDDLDHPSSFKFSDGSPLGGYNEWIPDLSNTERTGCVILDHEESFMWRGVDKTKHEDYFICEINKEAGHER